MRCAPLCCSIQRHYWPRCLDVTPTVVVGVVSVVECVWERQEQGENNSNGRRGDLAPATTWHRAGGGGTHARTIRQVRVADSTHFNEQSEFGSTLKRQTKTNGCNNRTEKCFPTTTRLPGGRRLAANLQPAAG